MNKKSYLHTLQNSGKILDDGIDIDDDGIWIYLAIGWCWEYRGQHMIHEDTIKDIKLAWQYVKPCDCRECLSDQIK
jgi:hypothetical protein